MERTPVLHILLTPLKKLPMAIFQPANISTFNVDKTKSLKSDQSLNLINGGVGVVFKG